MREILFRGKRLDNGGWVEGYYVSHQHVAHYIIPVSPGGYEAADGSFYAAKWYGVDPETVGQYTGLKDKNGKKIFEGDLLNGFRYPYLSNGEHNYFEEVVWFNNCPAFGLYTHKHPLSAVRGISAGISKFMDDFDGSWWEIIGNTHDNPDLLGGN